MGSRGQDWDLFLRVTNLKDAEILIFKVLYHWRKTKTSTAKIFVTKTMSSILPEKPWMKLENEERFWRVVSVSEKFSYWRIKRFVPGQLFVSILIPTKNKQSC